MAKITLNNLTTFSSGSAVTTLNNNLDAIETAFENTLSRDGTSPNHMLTNLDMNSYRIQNLVAAVGDTEPVRLAEMNTELAALETTVQAIATTTQGYLNSVISLYDQFDDRYLGNKASDPTTDNDGGALSAGMLYFNTTSLVMKVYNGTAWNPVIGNVSSSTLDDLSDVTITAAASGDVLRYDGAAWVDYADSNFLARANHTGTQLSTTISDFTEAAQDATGAMVDTTLVYTDATPLLSRAALTGHVTASAGSNTLALGSFTLAELNTAVSDADVLSVATAASTYQPLDADLTALAAGTLQNVATIDATTEATIEAAIDTLANLTSVQSLTIALADAGADAVFGWDDSASQYTNLSAADVRTALGLVIGTNVQAFDADLTTWAGLTPSANAQSLVTAANYAAMRALLDLEVGVDFNAYDAQLADIAAIAFAQGDIMYYNGTNVVALGPGTSGQFLKTQGAAANPVWATIAGGGDMLAANNLSDVANAATAFSNIKQAGTTAATGVLELATDAETQTGTDTARAITPANLRAAAAGKKAIWIDAAAMRPKATNGAGFSDYDSGTNDVTLRCADFDTTTQEYAHFKIAMPDIWDEGTVTFKPYWTNTSGLTTETVVFSLAGVSVSNDDALNATMGTAQTSSDTWLAQNDLHVGPESAAITLAGTPAAGDLVVFEVSRAVASDNMTGDARLIGIMLYVTTNAFNEP